jgi:hypothetical protein
MLPTVSQTSDGVVKETERNTNKPTDTVYSVHLIELNCSFITQKNDPMIFLYIYIYIYIYIIAVLYRSYMFRRHLHHLQGALNQDLKLTKI